MPVPSGALGDAEVEARLVMALGAADAAASASSRDRSRSRRRRRAAAHELVNDLFTQLSKLEGTIGRVRTSNRQARIETIAAIKAHAQSFRGDSAIPDGTSLVDEYSSKSLEASEAAQSSAETALVDLAAARELAVHGIIKVLV